MSTIVRAAIVLVVMLSASAPVRAEATTEQREEIGAIIREYILANPELLEEAIGVLQDRRAMAEAEAQANAVAANGDIIFDSEHQVVLGNPDGAITMVEFFDYNCGFCRRALSDTIALMEANDDLRVVLKEFPILSEGSVESARIGAALNNIAPESYMDFHVEVFSRPGQANAAKALEVAGDLGVDVAALEEAAEAPQITENITEVRALAAALGITGTPSYIIGTEIVPGAVGFDELQMRIEAMRECGETMC